MNKKTKTIKTINRSKSVKKIIFIATCMSVLATSFALNAFALDFSDSAQTALQSVVNLIGAGLGGWGLVILIEAYGSDNPGGKSQGIKQLVAGVALILAANTIVPAIFSQQ